MKQGKENEMLRSTGNFFGKNKMSDYKFPSFWWLVAFWFGLGQLLMIVISLTNGVIEYPANFVMMISEIIPSVASVRDANIFNNQIAILHYSTMWLISAMFCVILVFYPVGESERNILKKAKNPVLLSVIYLAIGFFNMQTNFYTGFYSFGLARFSFGFALLSSFSTFIFPYALRFLLLVINKGEKND